MPWGYECRAKLVKQNTAKPTVPRISRSLNILPSPLQYETPQLIGGKGYSHIRKAPAYTFGTLTPAILPKKGLSNKAPDLNISGCTSKGPYKIPYGLMLGDNDLRFDNRGPGPTTYDPLHRIKVKRPPAYSMGIKWKPPYQYHNMWTPSPNMYLPPIAKSKAPAFTMGYNRKCKEVVQQGPQELEPKHEYVMKTVPAYSFGYPHRESRTLQTPAVNAYCEKKFLVTMPSAPAPSFGIRHTPYLGKEAEHLKTSELDLAIRAYDQ